MHTDQDACRVIVDRYALPDGADPNACDPGKQTWCGGTWNTIRANLDYIQDAGFTASTFFAPSVLSVGDDVSCSLDQSGLPELRGTKNSVW